MKLVALVENQGVLEVKQFNLVGDVVWHGLVEDNAVGTVVVRDVQLTEFGAVPDVETETKPGISDYEVQKQMLETRLIGANRDEILITKLTFGYEEIHVEAAPFGEIIVFCDADYKGRRFRVMAKSGMNEDFIANYLEKMIWERLKAKQSKIDAAQN